MVFFRFFQKVKNRKNGVFSVTSESYCGSVSSLSFCHFSSFLTPKMGSQNHPKITVFWTFFHDISSLLILTILGDQITPIFDIWAIRMLGASQQIPIYQYFGYFDVIKTLFYTLQHQRVIKIPKIGVLEKHHFSWPLKFCVNFSAIRTTRARCHKNLHFCKNVSF